MEHTELLNSMARFDVCRDRNSKSKKEPLRGPYPGEKKILVCIDTTNLNLDLI